MIFKIVTLLAAVSVLKVECVYQGKPTPIEDNPHLVTVLEDDEYRCAGAILSPNHILAYGPYICDKREINVTFSIRSGTEKKWDGGKHTRVANIICPETRDQDQNNLAILVLSRKCSLTFDEKTNKVLLASEKPKIGTVGVVSGIGSLNAKHVPVTSFRSARISVTKCPFADDTNAFCAGGRGGPKLCRNDVGASLIVDGKLAGFDNARTGCFPENLRAADFYTTIADHKDWIEKMMRKPLPEGQTWRGNNSDECTPPDTRYTRLIRQLRTQLQSCEDTKTSYAEMLKTTKEHLQKLTGHPSTCDNTSIRS